MKTILLPGLGQSFFQKITTIIFIFSSIFAFGALKTAVLSGNYNSNSTWSPAGAPVCGDAVYIPAGISVTVCADANYYDAGCTSAMQFTIAGTLYFTQTNRLSLPCNSEVWVATGGLVDGEANNNSQRVFICDVEVWSGRDPGAGYQYWYIGLLPIELVNFDVKEAGKKNIVKWETSSEIENDYFEIERSEDGVYFYPIKKVSSKAVNGTSNSAINYEIMDENVLNGRSYYRLKQIDIHKKITFSRIVSLERNAGNEIEFVIYPNPSNGKVFVNLKGIETNKEVGVKFYNNNGQLIRQYYTDAFTIQSDDFNKELGEFNETGMYMVVFTMDGKNYNGKLILQ